MLIVFVNAAHVLIEPKLCIRNFHRLSSVPYRVWQETHTVRSCAIHYRNSIYLYTTFIPSRTPNRTIKNTALATFDRFRNYQMRIQSSSS